MKKQPGHVKGILDGLLSKWEKQTVKRANALFKAWVQVVPEKERIYTKPVSFKKGTLLVIVENSTMLYKLTLEKRIILKKINEAYVGRKKVADIRFRIGNINDE